MPSVALRAKRALVSTASILSFIATPALAQTTAPSGGTTSGTLQSSPQGETTPTPSPADAAAGTTGAGQAVDVGGIEEIVVTAQRRAESLQDVPIAVTAFSGEALETQQINNTLDLQLSLPNVSYTQGNFNASNITIRGIGASAVAASGDSGVGIHYNDMPLQAPRLFETEFFDVERIEVLRGPQGTLFGRNATSGVVNIITAKPDDEFAARAEAEYGNYDSIRAEGMVNVPMGDMLAVRLAGLYLNRDGFTKNLFDNSRIDGRDNYTIRGSVRFEPGEDTRLDIVGSYFREKSDRSRIQKQLCSRDPTGVMGCRPDQLAFETPNGNATLTGTITSREFLGALGLGAFALGSVSGTDLFAGVVNPSDVRTVRIDYNPRYKSDEIIVMGRLEHDFGNLTASLVGGYSENSLDSRTDYNLAVTNPVAATPAGVAGLAAFNAVVNNPNVVRGTDICVSNPDRSYVGTIGGRIDRCAANTTEFDRATGDLRQYSVEAKVNSDFDGPLNFLLGGIYFDSKISTNYFVAFSAADYAAALFGLTPTGPVGGLAAPFFNNEANDVRLKAYAAFGEVYFEPSDELRFTAGLRFTRDKKTSLDVFPQPLFNLGVLPYGIPTARDRIQFREAGVKFNRLTGRAVVDWTPETSFSNDTLVYASYSRGYKAGGINPAFDPTLFQAPTGFAPETINAFEIGTKNTFRGGAFRANLSAFYYDYKDLQISRIINRTSFNDNTNAEVYGLEGEFLIAPHPAWLFNINTSYLHTKIKELQLVDTRDPSGGRSDTVIIKDLESAANCVVRPSAEGVPRGDALVNAFNAAIGAGATQPVPGTTATGAFSFCQALASTIASTGLPYDIVLPVGTTRSPAAGGFAPITDPAVLGTVNLPSGNEVDLTGNQLPNSPRYKVSVGGQYTQEFGNGMNAVLRVDYYYTGEYFGRNFNKRTDRIPSYDVLNAQVTLNGPGNRWFVRGFVQNLTDNDAVTGIYVTDPSSGMFTNIFTLEPRRYGVSAGVRF
jgi:outer membrane receptor protein involved in Fe transport